ncbi:acylneuraminate cytidylyltransferase family protein [Lacrimispora sp.]|jgi:CMP-N-acetylneuraminic acid synthetase|uniref:acylneuraminate cytidylyltransferase family protein n=1 Tax=Lacrimispora sp. TaxID=2719234 RepID=UPI0028A0D1CC|nr:acylneuraminate cytidylyltransferase family protein [Lacrimispora sp.]
MKVVSFIPIKLNNERLPGKNTLPLGNRVMCEYIFETVNKIESIDEKYVYCSDESIKKYILEGLKYLKRDTYLDGFQVKGLEIIDYFLKDVYADIYVLTHVTQPFTKSSSIAEALDRVMSGEYDSAFSAKVIQDYCWYKGKPFNYNMKDIVTTQNLEPIYMETGAFYIFTREVFEKYRQRIGIKPYMKVISQIEAVDVDTADDYEFAKAVAEHLNKDNVRY